MRLQSSPRFERSYRKTVRRNPHLQRRLDDTLRLLAEDLGSSVLQTHKLSGNLTGLWACSCGYDCRIAFAIEQDLVGGEDIVVLIDIGTHDEVY